jgi:uncharacterized protein (TIGR00725 family)
MDRSLQKILISVIGARDCDDKVGQLARKVGALVAKMDCILVNGGLSGTMEESARGCKEAGGTTIGLIPGKDKKDANPYIDIPITTTIGFARNAIVACTGDIIIALPGSYGTNSEICYALVYNRPVIDVGNWNIPGMIKLPSIDDLEILLKDLVDKVRSEKGYRSNS